MSRLDALDMLEKSLQNSDVVVQLRAVKHLKIVAQALDEVRLQTQLIPVLEKYCFPPPSKELSVELEEVKAEIAAALDDEFAKYLGGSNICGVQLLPLLERLASEEETVIRQKAVASLNKCFSFMSPADVANHGFSVYIRLSSKDWFTDKVSAANLTAGIYSALETKEKKHNVKQLEILETHKKLLKEEMPMVRSEAYAKLPDLIRVAPSSFYQDYGKHFLSHLFKEIPSHGRVSAVKVILSFLKHLPSKGWKDEQIFEKTWPWFEKAVLDESWRVRNEFATHLPEISKLYEQLSVPFPPLNRHVLKLLSDQEPHVRITTIKHLPDACPYLKLGSPSIQDEFLEKLTAISRDQLEVREACSEHICEIFSKSKNLNTSKLLQIIKNFTDTDVLDAEQEGSHMIRLHIANNVGQLCELLEGPEQRKLLLTQCKEWQEDAKWRVRYAVTCNLSILAKVFGEEEFSASGLRDFLLASFTDNAFQVREECCNQVKHLAKLFGNQYIEKDIVETLQEIFKKNKNYLHRSIIFKAAIELCDSFDNDDFAKFFLPSLIAGLNDPVPNVRIACTKACIKCLPIMKNSNETENFTKLVKLLEEKSRKDKDRDVKYFSMCAIDNLKKS